MKDVQVDVFQEFTLNWRIEYTDLQVSVGSITFSDMYKDPRACIFNICTPDSPVIHVSRASRGWREALEVMVDTITLTESDHPNPVTNESSSFWFDAPTEAVDISWCLSGFGFGQFVLSCPGGYPHLKNEFVSRDTVRKIFQAITYQFEEV